MFAGEAFEPDIGFDHEFYSFCFEAVLELVPVVPIQYYSIVGDWNIVAIDGVVVEAFFFGGFWFEMDNELMAEQIEVDPLVAASAFFAAENIAIKCPGLDEIINGDCYMERADLFHMAENTMESPILMGKF